MQAYILKQDYSKQKEFLYFLASDLHFGNKGQNKALLKKDFDEAKRLDAKIFINGDWGEFIMSGDMKRYHPSSDAYGTDNNINMTINEAFDFLSDYVQNIVMIGTGNHEVGVSKFHHFDATQQLIYSLNLKHKTSIIHGQYSGYIVLHYHRNGSAVRRYKIYYNHGQGTTAEVTKGTINLSRHMATKISDLAWLGHLHTKVVLPSEYVIDVNQQGDIIQRERAGLITGAYLNVFHQYDAMKKGYNISYGEEKMRGLQSTGGAMLKIKIIDNEIIKKIEV